MSAASQVGLLPLLLLACTVASCSWVGKDGTRHSLVLGIGILSTKEQVSGAAMVTKTSVLGLAMQANPAMRGLIVGYSESLLTQIPPRWEGHLSISKSSGKPLRIQSSFPEGRSSH